MKPRNLIQRATAIISLLACHSAQAASGTWNVDANGIWSLNTNWLNNIIADASGFTANFNNNITADRTVSLDGDRTLTSLIFGDSDTSTAGSWILDNNGTSTNNLILAGTAPTITVNALGTGKTATISAIIEGTAGLTKAGAGTLTLSGANTYTGGTVLNSGTLNINNAAATGAVSSSVTINGGTLDNTSGAAITLSASTTRAVTINGDFTFTGTSDLNMGGSNGNSTSTLSLGTGTRTITVSAGTLTLSPNITSTNTLVKEGDGTLFFQQSNTNSKANALSGMTINQGRLQVRQSNAAYLGTGSISLGKTGVNSFNAALDAAGLNTTTNNITVNAGSSGILAILASANNNNEYAGTVTLNNNLTLARQTSGNNAITTFSGVISSTGNLSIGNTSGTTIGGASLVNSGTYILSGANTYTGTTQINSGTLQLGNNSALQNSIFDPSGAGSLTFSSGINTPTFGGLTSATNLTMASNVTALTLNPGTGVTTTYSGVLGSTTAGMTLTKTGAGTQSLTGTNTYTGATNVTAGTLAITGSGSINASSGVTVATGANFVYNSSTTLTKSLSLSGASSSSRAILGGSGTIGATVSLDNIGDTLSPGNSPGIQTFTTAQTWSSFSYDWEVNNFTGTTAGTDFDQLGLNTLNLTGGSASYILNILSLTASNVAGNVPNFSEVNRSWTILTSNGGITGFNAANWLINAAGFADNETGSWALAQSGNDLVLSYAVVPEPNVAALIGGLGMLVLLRRRR
jgi:autotransporter-associated beta strand protein